MLHFDECSAPALTGCAGGGECHLERLQDQTKLKKINYEINIPDQQKI